ncbi:MAG: NAD(P)-dependent oxidoreductase [Vulcanimicrobiaceae bacterium]
MPLRIGLVGLGIMGSAYAGHLIEGGFPTVGYDPDAAALQRYVARGGRPAASPSETGRLADVVIVALSSVAAVEAAIFGEDGLAAAMVRGKIVLDAGTFDLDLKERMRDALERNGASVLDTPVSGTGSQAQKKDLVFFASGERDAFDRARGVLGALARDVRYVGPFGNGSKLKYIANLLVTIHNLSTAEAIVLGERAGISAETLLDVLGDSAATSRMFQVRGPMMASHTYEPATMRLEVYQKDIDIIDGFAKALRCPTPLFSASKPFYERAIERGRGKEDTAAIVSVLRESAGLPAD